jgi:hypothetical protein
MNGRRERGHDCDKMRLGRVSFLHDDEIDLIWNKERDRGGSRSWEYFLARSRRK